MTVSSRQRFTRTNPCPVCGGHEDLPTGSGVRCWGFFSDDGEWAHCTREEHRGRISAWRDGTFVHKLTGDCLCGSRHGGGPGLSTQTYRPAPSPRPSGNGTNGNGHGENGPAEVFTGLHLKDLADFKRLPLEFLSELGCQDDTYQGLPAVSFPCKDAKGNTVLTRYRRALTDRPGVKRFASQKGAALALYGLDRIATFRRPGDVFLVEGESDCWTGWFHGLPVIGVPGAKSWQSSWAAHLAGFTVFVWQEPGADGRLMVERVSADIPDLRVVVAPVGVKDISEAHLQGNDVGAFVADLTKQGRAAREVLAESAEETPPPRKSERAERGRIRCRTAAEIGETTAVAIPWIAEPWIALETLTELDGAIKASGKTTFTLALVRAVIYGEPFMGKATLRSPVVYLTEQPDTTFRQSLRRAGLLSCEDLHVITWVDTAGYSWEQVCQQALDRCREVGAKLLVADTLGQFSGVRGDSENDSGAARDAVLPLLLVAGAGIGVWIDRHDRKGGGAVGESGRGSSQYGGMVDTILRLHRTEGDSRPTIRQLDSLSRFDETPPSLIIELKRESGRDEYVALGSEADVVLQLEKEKIFDAAPADGSPISGPALLGEHPSGTHTRALKALVGEGRLLKDGLGRKNSPFNYRRGAVEGNLLNAEGPDDSRQTPRIGGRNESAGSEAPEQTTVAAFDVQSQDEQACSKCGQSSEWWQRPDGTRFCGRCVQAAGSGRDS